jgi:assimilatory nitrate reductase catalytic subunit
MTSGPASGGTRTTCPYCGVGCGVVMTPAGDGSAKVAGDREHPANFGKLCVKGASLGETLALEGRLLHPMIHGQRSTWNQATGFVADGLARVLAEHGPGAIGFYLSGQLLTEDYYIANKFAKGFLGTCHVDTNSRLCMASSVAGHRRAFGSDTVPNTYEDLDEADLIVLVGSNAAWCHPVLYQRMQAARHRRGTRIVNIDPRRTATSEGADLQLAIASGMDSVLFSWLLVSLAGRGVIDRAYIAAFTSGFDAALASASAIAPDLATVSAKTGLAPADIERFIELFASTQRVVTCYSQGVNQSAQGTDKVNAILNCHLATARIGKPGSGPLSLTGQPNAMGGREVGGLANMLAAHMNYSPAEIDRVQRFWNAPRMATGEGLKAVQMFEAIERGEIRALWVMHTNPAVTLPRADAMQAALRKLDLFVVSEAMASTDTTQSGAHVLLPASAWGEKDGTVTNSERRIFASARLSAHAGRSQAGLGAHSACGPAHGPWRALRLCQCSGDLPGTCSAVRLRERWTTRLRYRRSGRNHGCRVSMRWSHFTGPGAKGLRRRSDSLPMAVSTRRIAGDGSLRWSSRRWAASGQRASRCCSTPGGCATTGTP